MRRLDCRARPPQMLLLKKVLAVVSGLVYANPSGQEPEIFPRESWQNLPCKLRCTLCQPRNNGRHVVHLQKHVPHHQFGISGARLCVEASSRVPVLAYES